MVEALLFRLQTDFIRLTLVDQARFDLAQLKSHHYQNC